MPRYSVDVKAFIAVDVDAPDEQAAIKQAEAWVDWLSPTMEQIADYQEDHDGLVFSGIFAIDGDSDVEVLTAP